MTIWQELIGDRIVEPPYQIESTYIMEVLFFESGKVIVISDYGYEGMDVEVYKNREEFEKDKIDGEHDRIIPAVVVDAPGYVDPQKTTDDTSNVEFTLSDWVQQELKIQLSEEMARFVNSFKKAD